MEENFASIASAISSSAAHTLQGDNLKLLDEVCLVLIFFKRASSEVDFPMSSSDHCGHFELRSCGTSKKKKKKDEPPITLWVDAVNTLAWQSNTKGYHCMYELVEIQP